MSDLKDKLLRLTGLNTLAESEDYPKDVCDDMIALRAEVVADIEKQHGALLRLMAGAGVLRVLIGDEGNCMSMPINSSYFDTNNEYMVNLFANEVQSSCGKEIPEAILTWFAEAE